MPNATPSSSAVALHLAAYVDHLDATLTREYAALAHGVDIAKADMARLGASLDLSAAGRVKAVEGRRREALKVLLDPVRQRIARIEHRLADVEREALPPHAPTQDLGTLLLQREIRDRLTGRDSLEVLQHAVSAVERGDDELLHAIEGAPRSFPLLAPEHAATLRQMRLEHSAVAPLLAQLNDELKIHTALLQAAEFDLNGDAAASVATTSGDPTAASAVSGAP
jgi:hypothetical protein